MSPACDDIDGLAGEHVLGTLSAAQRRQVEERLSPDARLRTAVQGWHERLLPLATLAQPVDPSAQLWRRIESSLGAGPEKAGARPAVAATATSGWWGNVAFWRGLAGTGFAVAALMAAVLLAPQP
jgi:anti-sigma-K factor RskA